MQCGLRRLLKLSLLLAYASTQVIAQTPAAPSAPAPPRNLSEFEGLYEYRDDGRPSVYRYEKPIRLPDGIRAGEAGPETLSTEVAERLVNVVIDGAYPDVRSILIYHR